MSLRLEGKWIDMFVHVFRRCGAEDESPVRDAMRRQNRQAYAVSHVGWGLNRRARWHAMQFYDKADFNGTELRAFAGNFLYNTGANEVAGRHTLGHFDLPMRGCTVPLDGLAVVEHGVLL